MDMVSRTQRKQDHKTGEMLNLWALGALFPCAARRSVQGGEQQVVQALGQNAVNLTLVHLVTATIDAHTYWRFHTVFASALAGSDCMVQTPGKTVEARSL